MTTATPHCPDLPAVYFTRDYGERAIRAALKEGRLIQVRRGAYIEAMPGEAPWALRERLLLGRCVAVASQLSSGHVLSHTTAAQLHGCALWTMDDDVHVCQEARAANSRSPMLRRHSVPLSGADVTTISGLPVTTLERTIEDCALTLHPRDGLVVADSGLRILTRPDRWHRPDSLRRIREVRQQLQIRLVRRRGHRGIRTARAVLAHADPFAESAPESVLRWIALSRGLPMPVAQLRVETSRGVFFSDLGWILRELDGAGSVLRSITFHAEFDGRVKYLGPRASTPRRPSWPRSCGNTPCASRVTRFDGSSPRIYAPSRRRFVACAAPSRPRSSTDSGRWERCCPVPPGDADGRRSTDTASPAIWWRC
ncbi:hypothetical protein FE374_18505 [Georgenia yuyongxinii]|uniref:Transcriptional regulator, AbiEi antitoxin, Type IV TA system n=1 Tax=Georgenia yuyongxinii TaxID=2589797 RepID=A0A5B8CDQ8_9MICO|nr:hypothetical protein [Georgenia yuyongxinii]QDC26336.1 hypothetical protein FE374_18505 [Georgenia yuyongxinii]